MTTRAVGLPGPATRGIRVDRRAGSVDVLENALSFGRLAAILQATLDAAALHRRERLLDLGCGTGRLAVAATRLFAPAQALETLGIDATPAMVERARARAAREGCPARFEVGVAEALPAADASIGAVTSSYFFHHLPPDVKRQALREMWRVLAPGGRLVITITAARAA